MRKIEAHPDAAIFPMLSEDELAALAEDIKENGLRHPIIIGKHEDQEVIIDGRNRYAACEMAGVEPRFEQLNGHDPKAFILSMNVKRRHMTAGQRAMATALVYPDPTPPGSLTAGSMRRSGERSKASLFSEHAFSKGMLSYARVVLRHSRTLADAVMSGTITLNEAYNNVKAADDAAKSADAMLHRLQSEAPDLADLVSEGRLQLKEAITALDSRIAEARRTQETATRVLQTIFNAIFPRGATPDEWAERLTKDVNADYWSGADELSHKNLLACADVMRAIAERWKG